MSSVTAVSLSFSVDGQAETALRAAAYRMAGLAICQVDLVDRRWVCSLSPTGSEEPGPEQLKKHFLSILNDENLRESIEIRVSPIRDVIVALAFGALAHARQQTTKSNDEI
jgi:His-Xaa-Ser system protein HxsD